MALATNARAYFVSNFVFFDASGFFVATQDGEDGWTRVERRGVDNQVRFATMCFCCFVFDNDRCDSDSGERLCADDISPV